jgi:hypothetical protein
MLGVRCSLLLCLFVSAILAAPPPATKPAISYNPATGDVAPFSPGYNFGLGELKVGNVVVGSGGASLLLQTGNAGTFLTTNSTIAAWDTVSFSSLSGKPTGVSGSD